MLKLRGEFIYKNYEVEIDGKKVTSEGHDSISSLYNVTVAHNKVMDRPEHFPAVPNDGMIEF
jgi:hypothetical protein